VAVAALLGALAMLAMSFVTLSARPAAAAEPCVGVIVDARLLGGGVSTGCATGDPDTGLEALTKAGYGYAFVPRQPGLVCQINGAPECSRTSIDTYWSYWYRAKGSSTWVYASQGAGSHDPPPGSTEAWVWQDGGRRRPPDIALRTICPQVASSRTPTKSSSPSPDRSRTASRSPSPQRSSSTQPAAAASGRTSEKPATRATTSAAPTSSTADPTSATAGPTSATAGPSSASPSSSLPSTRLTTAGAAADDGGGAPPWTGLVVGGVLIAALGGAALARSRHPGSTGGGP
jgi:hypothetical protein